MSAILGELVRDEGLDQGDRVRRRIRVTATIDGDGASPDSITAAQEYLTDQMLRRAIGAGVCLDWGSWRTIVRRSRKTGDLTLIQWAKVLRG